MTWQFWLLRVVGTTLSAGVALKAQQMLWSLLWLEISGGSTGAFQGGVSLVCSCPCSSPLSQEAGTTSTTWRRHVTQAILTALTARKLDAPDRQNMSRTASPPAQTSSLTQLLTSKHYYYHVTRVLDRSLGPHYTSSYASFTTKAPYIQAPFPTPSVNYLLKQEYH